MRFKVPRPFADKPVVEEEKAPQDIENTTANDKETGVTAKERDSSLERDDSDAEFQRGDEAIRAMTQIWTKRDLIIAYFLIWLVCFIQAFSDGIISTMVPYVTSNFGLHSLTSTMSIVASLVSGLIKLPYAKLLNIWGRPQSFGLAIIVMTLGLIMMAACNSVYVYAAALVFYNVGYSTISYTTTIFIADTSSLKSRALMLGFASSPYLATVWAYGPAAQDALEGIGFRWGLGVWAIVYPAVCAPLWALFYFYQRKAEKAGLIKSNPSDRSLVQSIIYWGKEFDVIGLLLVATGLALFLLSFSIYSYQKNEWKSPLIICFLIFGGLLVIAFGLWEKYLAPVTFIPWHLITNRTIIFTYTMMASIYTAWYVWDNYFYSFLVVVFRESVTHATYITNIYTVGSCFMAIVMGVVILYNGRLKWQALYFGVPLTVLGVALMIKFRQPDTNIGYIVMCQIFIAFGGGILVICEQMTVMAVSTQREIPAVIAMESMIANVGGAIGSAIAAAMWTGIFPKKLLEYLPEDDLADFASIYGDMTIQASYADGTDTREAIVHAYADTQRLMLITATSLYAITLFSVLMWKDVNVKKIKQVKGVVW
ncbi:major facilitator superfamily domain-containing protein [Dactylonectria macrodidyma]|uniref:Major facilitator superfamily domain-containing protein n=1 Tax=Dactylonectria macrodidyma TaxID=307937 RepID=A0A9P9FLT1_9HYPO|nr:major facilitator superfamily domain-containing protein [Dactylonectria macrodidyma]